MDLRLRFVARAPKFARPADLFDDASGKRFAIGGRQQRKEARLFSIESETARREPFLSEFRENRAAPKHKARLGKCHFTMKGAAYPPTCQSRSNTSMFCMISPRPAKGGNMQIELMLWPCPDPAKHAFRNLTFQRALPHYARFGVAAAGNFRRTGSARSGATRTRT
jgi:hypothetical protein